MRHINQINKTINTINRTTWVMSWLIVGLWQMVSFGGGTVLYISRELATDFPHAVYQGILIATFLLIFSYYMVFSCLRHHAEINSNSPYFIVDDNGISLLGLGVARDIYISWDNIKKYKGYGSSNYAFRIWTKEPHNTWMSKSLIYKILGSVINIISFGLVTKNFELSFYQLRPALLGLTKLEFQETLDKQINLASKKLWKPASGWKNTSTSKLNPKYKLLYFAPPLFMLVGFFSQCCFNIYPVSKYSTG